MVILALIWTLLMYGVHVMIKHMLKILQQILQDFERVFYHFLITRN